MRYSWSKTYTLFLFITLLILGSGKSAMADSSDLRRSPITVFKDVFEGVKEQSKEFAQKVKEKSHDLKDRVEIRFEIKDEEPVFDLEAFAGGMDNSSGVSLYYIPEGTLLEESLQPTKKDLFGVKAAITF